MEWTTCRENPNEDTQAEGIVVDEENDILYVGFEDAGLYKIEMASQMPDMVEIGIANLIQPVKIFGQSYIAVPNDDEFECEYNPEREPEAGEIFMEGDESLAGEHIEADLEGITIYFADNGEGYLIASSQGDSTFQIFEREGENEFVGAFQISGVGSTDGLDVVNVPLGSNFPDGLLAVHNGEAPEPDDTSDINGFEYDGSTRFDYVGWEDVADAFPEGLIIDTD